MDIIDISGRGLSVYTNQISHVRVHKNYALIDLFSKNLRNFLSRESVEEIFNSINKKENDCYVYSLFRNIIKDLQSKSSNEEFKSEVNGVRELEDKKSFSQKWVPKKGRESRESARRGDIFRFYRGSPLKYLDLGGGDGKITSSIGSYLNLSRENIYCADVQSWWDYDRKKTENITYKTIYEGKRLPFKNEEFSLITCFQSIHHMKNLDFVFSELYRITEKGGYIIIREHDCDNGIIKMLIDIEHCIFETVLKDIPSDFIKDYYGDYRSKSEWSNLFYKHGFSYCNKRYNFKINRNNPTRYYYSMYCKK